MSATTFSTIAKAIIPNARQSGPLTAEELVPVTSAPTFAEGINLTRSAQIYLAALAGKELEGIPALAQADDEASTGTLRRDLRILIDLDTKVHQRRKFKTYEKYYTHETGRKISRSTVWRRRLHAEFALLLGAQGRPELLPSQRQCELLRKHLARVPSVLLLLSIGDPAVLHRMGETKFIEEVELYRVKNQLRPVGECVDHASDPSGNPHQHPRAERDADAALVQEIAGLLRKGGGPTIKPACTAAAVYEQLHKVIAEVPERMEIASKIADAVSKRSKGIAVLAVRACLIRLISETLASAAGGR
jgi:hypothetical protein